MFTVDFYGFFFIKLKICWSELSCKRTAWTFFRTYLVNTIWKNVKTTIRWQSRVHFNISSQSSNASSPLSAVSQRQNHYCRFIDSRWQRNRIMISVVAQKSSISKGMTICICLVIWYYYFTYHVVYPRKLLSVHIPRKIIDPNGTFI